MIDYDGFELNPVQTWTRNHPYELRTDDGEFLARFSNSTCAARTAAWLGPGHCVMVNGAVTSDWRQSCREAAK